MGEMTSNISMAKCSQQVRARNEFNKCKHVSGEPRATHQHWDTLARNTSPKATTKKTANRTTVVDRHKPDRKSATKKKCLLVAFDWLNYEQRGVRKTTPFSLLPQTCKRVRITTVST